MIKSTVRNKPPQFLLKLYHIVNLPSSDYVVSWDITGEKIIIRSEKLFSEQIMK